MSVLHVRNAPDALYECLRRRAEAQRRSLGAEGITLLIQALDRGEQAPPSTLDSIRSRRFYPEGVGAPDRTALLREDRER